MTCWIGVSSVSSISLSFNMDDSDAGEQYPEEPTGDNDLGVEYGEMVVQSYDGNVQSSDDSEGGEGVSIFAGDDAASSPNPSLLDDSIGDMYDIGDIDLEDVASSSCFDSFIGDMFDIGDVDLEDVASSSCFDSFGDSVGEQTSCGES